jgi:hypothetical protein
MNLLSLITELEASDDLHIARLLILMNAFGTSAATGKVEGLTKLAKLDFLLRYPPFLERALIAVGANPELANVMEHERRSVESSMIRFRYGPWDHRYRRLINIMVAKGLVRVELDRQPIVITLTQSGAHIAGSLSQMPAFSDVSARATVLKRHFNFPATRLMRFVYDTFPELSSLSFGEDIAL